MLKIHAFFELIQRYAKVIRYAWLERKQLESRRLLACEAEFLPSALALKETPISPVPRMTMWLLIMFAAIAFMWALFGRVDIVATAYGKIIPNDHTKIIQPSETAVVTAIHVKDGQNVKAGDTLIELDATFARADAERVSNDLLTAKLESIRYQTFLEALKGRKSKQIWNDVPVSLERKAAEQRLLEGLLAEYDAKREKSSAEIARREAEELTTLELIKKLQQTLPIVRQRVEDYKVLLKGSYISKHSYMDREQVLLEHEQDLAVQSARLAEVWAAHKESTRQLEALQAETQRIALDQLHQSEEKIASLSQELVKAEQKQKLLKITAPVNGTVQQLAVHTIGGVVTPAQPLMMIVPDEHFIEVEAFIENKDIGFIYPNQMAEVKVETFSYTKYGTIPAKVITVSSDAIQDEKRGLIYAARVKLDRATLVVDDKKVDLSPGMAVTVEVKTGKRRILEYFLSPLLQYGNESLRER